MGPDEALCVFDDTASSWLIRTGLSGRARGTFIKNDPFGN